MRQGRVTILNSVAKEGPLRRQHLNKCLKEVKRTIIWASGGRVLQTECTAQA